jgi:hypothetical protein
MQFPTHKDTTMKRQMNLFFVLVLLLAIRAEAGVFFDDPVELQATHVPNTFSKDEIQFAPTGKCKAFMIREAELTLILTYSTGTRTLFASKTFWSNSNPVTFSLPDNLNGLQSYQLKGKFGSVFVMKKGWWAVRDSIEPQVNSPDPATRHKAYKEMVKYMDFLNGYKIDSKWHVNSQ